jgi:hypothetical protein
MPSATATSSTVCGPSFATSSNRDRARRRAPSSQWRSADECRSDCCAIELVGAAEHPGDLEDDARNPGTRAGRYAPKPQRGSLVLLLFIAHEQPHDDVRVKCFHDPLRLRRRRRSRTMDPGSKASFLSRKCQHSGNALTQHMHKRRGAGNCGVSRIFRTDC